MPPVRSLLFFACLLSAGLARAQDPPAAPDPIFARHLAAFHAAASDSLRLIAMDSVLKRIKVLQCPRALEPWPDSMLAVAQALNDTARIDAALSLKCEYLSRAGEFVKLEPLIRYQLSLIDPERDPRGYISRLMSASYATAQRGDPDLALERLFMALKYADREEVKPGVRAQLKYSLGRAYLDRGEPAKALPYFRESMAWSREKNVLPAISQNLDFMGLAHQALGLLDSALAEQSESVAIERQLGDAGEIARQLVQLGTLQEEMGKSAEARTGFTEALRLADSGAFNDERVRARLGLARQLWRQRKDPLPLLLQAEAIADSIRLYPELREIELLLTQVYAAQGRNDKALAASQRVVVLGDTLFDIGKRKALLAMSMRYEAEEKDKAIAVLQQERELQRAHDAEQGLRIRRQQQLIIAACVIGVLLLLVSLLAFRAFRIKRRAAAALERTNAEVLRQKERAEESEKAKDRFLANVSHELRTPLNAILGFTGLLMHEARDERTERFLGNIRDAGDGLLVVINDVLDLSRIEAGRLQLVREPFDLHRTVRLCAEILRHRAAEHDNVLEVDIAPEVPQGVLGDSARLTQVLLNLVGNALKFTHEGDVRISVEKGTGDEVVLRVADTGIGIPADKLDAVFERFTQVHGTDQRVQGGTGLGLAVVKELVALHGGTVAVESAVGKGTTFTVHIAYPPAAVPLSPGLPTVRGGVLLDGRTILVAEDNDLNALVTEETLRRHYPGANVERVNDGEEVLARMRVGHDVALVLMDVQMPKRDGISAAAEIRSWADGRGRVPIIALTASVLPNDLSRCIAAGMDGCVPKPFRPEELVEAIDRITGSRAPAAVEEHAPDPEAELMRGLFRKIIPERLRVLKEARARGDREKVARVVHSIKPQLVHHDPVRFTALLDRLMSADAASREGREADLDRLVVAVERSLAEL